MPDHRFAPEPSLPRSNGHWVPRAAQARCPGSKSRLRLRLEKRPLSVASKCLCRRDRVVGYRTVKAAVRPEKDDRPRSRPPLSVSVPLSPMTSQRFVSWIVVRLHCPHVPQRSVKRWFRVASAVQVLRNCLRAKSLRGMTSLDTAREDQATKRSMAIAISRGRSYIGKWLCASNFPTWNHGWATQKDCCASK